MQASLFVVDGARLAFDLAVSRRAEKLERFEKWSDTPAAVEVREARSDRRHSICRAALVSQNSVHKEFLET
jgi:hypothetical protein